MNAPVERRARLGIRGKLFLISLGLILVSFAVGYFVIRGQLDRSLTNRIQSDLTVRAQLIGRQSASLDHPLTDIAAWNSEARAFGEAARARVTFVRQDGVVIGDSKLESSKVERLDNHGSRPEVRQAWREGTGVSQRYSATLGKPLLYVAVTVQRAEPLIARVAVPLTTVEAARARLRDGLGVAALLAFIVAVLLSSIAAQLASRSARTLTISARKMAEGDLASRTGMDGDDEFAELGGVLDKLAANLEQSLDQLRDERDRTHGILESMQEGVLLIDGDDRIVMLNAWMRETLLTTSRVIGEPLQAALEHPALRGAHRTSTRRQSRGCRRV